MKIRTKNTTTDKARFRYYRRPYPNAADPDYFLGKVLDGLLALATGMGSITIFFFLITM